MSQTNKKDKPSIISTGPEMIGAALASALSALTQDPMMAAGAGMVGVVATSMIKDMATRMLSSREKARIATTACIAIDSIKERLNQGDQPRSDGIFNSVGGQRSDAEEIFEGVLLAAKNTHEEQKIQFLGRLFANVAFDAECEPHEANHLIHTAETLTYAQLVLLQLISKNAVNSQDLHATEYGEDAKLHYATISLLQSIHALYNLNLVVMHPPQDKHFTFIMNLIEICPAYLKLSDNGKRLHMLLGLSSMQDHCIDDIAKWLRTSAIHQ